MAIKNKNDNGSDRLFYALVFSFSLGFASLFGLFVVTAFDVVAPLLLIFLIVGMVMGMFIGMSLLMVSSWEFWSSSIQYSAKIKR